VALFVAVCAHACVCVCVCGCVRACVCEVCVCERETYARNVVVLRQTLEVFIEGRHFLLVRLAGNLFQTRVLLGAMERSAHTACERVRRWGWGDRCVCA
jgi:hypothetical protein